MISATNLNSWVRNLSNSKPYRILMKNGQGFYEIMFLYGEYHYVDRVMATELNNELECQKHILNMCATFEKNFKLQVF